MWKRCAVLLLLVSFPALAKPPRLTLFITVDALGSDVLLRNRPRLKGGLAQILSQGAYFPYARYGYAEAVTASGHATLATGANPWRHGIVSNRVVNRSSGKDEAILADPGHPLLEAPPSSADVSPENLLAETLSDRLRVATQGRGKSVAIAGKPRASITMAGRLGQAWWFNEPVGKFVTGTYYLKEFPAWMKAFNDKKLPESYFQKEWVLAAPAREYVGDDDRPFESDWHGLKRTFPHPLTGGLPSPGPQSAAAFASSPYFNDVLVQLAKAAIAGEGLGKDDIPDLLSIGFSAIDRIYHLYGPYSWEMQDALIRLDRSLTELISAAEKAAGGRANLLVVLTADHGGAAIPEEWAAMGLPSARVHPNLFVQGLTKELAAKFGGANDLVLGIEECDVYLNNKVLTDKKIDAPAVRRAAVQWLQRQPQVAYAVSRDEINGLDTSAGLLRALRLGFHPDRSGDVLFLLKPFQVQTEEATGTNHGTPYSYDAQVPVVFMGKGVKPGTYRSEIDPVDVAPTAAAVLEIGSPASAEGKVRSEALGAAP